MSQNPLQNLSKENDQAVLPVAFIKVPYTTFLAEFAIVDGDLVFHFFLSPEVQAHRDAKVYWDSIFPAFLDPVAKEVFKADFPRLKAAKVAEFEIDSWWLRAFGFGYVLDPHKLAYRFLDALDLALDKKNET